MIRDLFCISMLTLLYVDKLLVSSELLNLFCTNMWRQRLVLAGDIFYQV